MFVFSALPMGVLAYAIQQYTGWSPVLFRVMRITALLHVSVIFIVFYNCGLHFNHLFIWLDPEVVAHDALIATKVGYLNFLLDC
jgi:hypothetical protein